MISFEGLTHYLLFKKFEPKVNAHHRREPLNLAPNYLRISHTYTAYLFKTTFNIIKPGLLSQGSH